MLDGAAEKTCNLLEVECLTAISQLAHNKSPGLDCFPVEFCKTV